MKELSIEEKAKRYDEILARAKCTNIPYYKDDIMSKVKEFVDYLLPELKESEDERIRENIIATIHLYYGEPLEDKAKEMIAWLEKQGNNMGISEATKQELEDNLNKALEKETPESCNEFLDEQGEQNLTNSAKTCKDEQKPAWSEEDELYIRELESLVKQVWATAEHKNDKDTIHKMSDLSFFLKTLKPQNRWKPSDEQTKALEHSLGDYNITIFEDRLEMLKSLYQDLKKLK